VYQFALLPVSVQQSNRASSREKRISTELAFVGDPDAQNVCSPVEEKIMKASQGEHSLINPSGASVRKRGRPRKSNHKLDEIDHAYWLGEVFIDLGWAWSTELVEVTPVQGERGCWEALPLCLGRKMTSSQF